MRAREYLFEDSRTKIQKLEELIAHPGTEDNVRQVAQSRLNILRSQMPVEPRRVMSAIVNVDEADMDQQYLTGVSLGNLYDNLCSLSPSPSEIHFGRQGVIKFAVKPPFMGKTRDQYVAEIGQACPGCRSVNGHMLGDGEGYIFVISFL